MKRDANLCRHLLILASRHDLQREQFVSRADHELADAHLALLIEGGLLRTDVLRGFVIGLTDAGHDVAEAIADEEVWRAATMITNSAFTQAVEVASHFVSRGMVATADEVWNGDLLISDD